MKPGSRLKSAACSTEVVVIRSGGGTISCGGAPMAEAVGDPVDLHPDFAGGTVTGKRYVDAAATTELLCVKAGQGSLAVDGMVLTVKDAKPLPASD